MEWKKIPKDIYLALAVIMAAAVFIAIESEQPALSLAVLIAGAVLAVWTVRIGLKKAVEKETRSAEATKTEAEAAEEEPLRKSGRDRHGR